MKRVKHTYETTKTLETYLQHTYIVIATYAHTDETLENNF
jgi:hypothetical protein